MNEGTQYHRIMVETSSLHQYISKCKILLQLQFNASIQKSCCTSCSCTIYFSSLYSSVFDMLSGDWHVYKKCYQAFPFLLGMSQEKQSVWCMENSSCRLQWPKLANNGAFQSKCVICLHRRESGLNTDTDSAHDEISYWGCIYHVKQQLLNRAW